MKVFFLVLVDIDNPSNHVKSVCVFSFFFFPNFFTRNRYTKINKLSKMIFKMKKIMYSVRIFYFFKMKIKNCFKVKVWILLLIYFIFHFHFHCYLQLKWKQLIITTLHSYMHPNTKIEITKFIFKAK